MSVAISFEHVSKHYVGSRRYSALRDDMTSAVRRMLGRRSTRDAIEALDDVSFAIPEGEAFAIIGANGAGKTTALKLATRIAYPTSGCVRVRGRVGALIEVGTGMHPELTGRENVQLYGRILGLSKHDVYQRFDQIVEFAGIGSAIDQVVKQYSSGMQLRLGFSIAAHLEPDVLLVDEAIAVGDAGFQYQCVERMSALVREGRTLVFVSHDMSAIETLCRRAILLRAGRISHDGPAREVVREYLQGVQLDRLAKDRNGDVQNSEFQVLRVSLHDAAGHEVTEIDSGQALTIRLHYQAQSPVHGPIVTLGLSDGRFGWFSLASMLVDGEAPETLMGRGFIDCTFDHLPLQPQPYEIWGEIRGEAGYGLLIDWQRLRLFRVAGELNGNGKSVISHSLAAPVKLPYHWSFGETSVDGS